MKKLKIGIITFILFISFSITSFAQIEFTEITNGEDWKELIIKSKETGMPLFLDIYASWCGPCKYLDKEVYTDSALAIVYNKLFLNAKIDGESIFGRQLVARYGLQAFPTMYFIGSDEEVISSIVGVREAGPLAETGKVISENMQKITEYEKAYANNTLNSDELMSYQSILVDLGQHEEASAVASTILQSLDDEKILDPAYAKVIFSSRPDIDGRIFLTLKENRARAFEVWGKDTAEQILNNIYNTSITKAIENNDSLYLNRIIAELLPVYAGNKQDELKYLQTITRKIYYANTGNWDIYKQMVLNDYQKNPPDQGQYLYVEAYELVKEYPRNIEAIDISATFINQALAISRNVENLLMTAYIEGMRANFDLAVGYLSEAESMDLTPQQKSMLEELKKIIEQVRQGK